LANIGSAVRTLLRQRNLFVKSEHDGSENVVYVCVDDGAPGGFPVGHVIEAAGGRVWLAYARVRTQGVFRNREVAVGLPSCDEAIRAVVEHASYADILRTAERSSAAATTTYVAVVDPGHAEWLAALEEPKGITHLGDGRVRFTESAVAYLRKPPPPLSLYVEVQGDELVVDLVPYQLTRER
jgi:hypothetical protein